MEIMLHNRYTDEFKKALEQDIRDGLEYRDILYKYKFKDVNTGLKQLFSKLKRKVTMGTEVKIINTANIDEVKIKQEQSRKSIVLSNTASNVSNATENDIKKQDIDDNITNRINTVSDVIDNNAKKEDVKKVSIENCTIKDSVEKQNIEQELKSKASNELHSVDVEAKKSESLTSTEKLQNTMSAVDLNPVLDSMLLIEQNNLSILEQTLMVKKVEVEYLKECIEHKKQYIAKLRSFIV